MTSVNALRVNRDQGILVCDEASYWNEEWMILYTPDKIQNLVEHDLVERHRLAMFVGMSGSELMGERVMDGLARIIFEQCQNLPPSVRGIPSQVLTLDQLAMGAFDIACETKSDYINDFLKTNFGFSTEELIAGSYERNGKTISIKDDDVQKEAMKYLTNKGAPPEVSHAFKNTLFVAGYKPEEGFRIFYLSTATPVCEEVSEIYINGGSGTDTNELVYADYANRVPLIEQREGIDLLDASIMAFSGQAASYRLTAGVAPYPNYTLVDGNSETFITKIFDKRAQLCYEVVAAGLAGLLTREKVRELVDGLLFRNVDFTSADRKFKAGVKNPRELDLFLRGYYQEGPVSPHSSPLPQIIK